MSRKKILLRVQSSEGTKRLEVESSDSTLSLFEKVHEIFGLDGFCFALYRERGLKEEILSSKSKSLGSLGLKHGDLIYLAPINGAILWPTEAASSSVPNNTPSGEPVDRSSPPGGSNSSGSTLNPSTFDSVIASSSNAQNPQEDEVDLQLWKLDGKIKRDRDSKFCRHGGNACCVHCSPLEPFDEAYLKEHNIKHMSFHSYLRKLTAGVDRGKFVMLEDISCKIKMGCKDHPPWPRGICSKCQPNAITLNRQAYRHVDNVMFENPQIVERFLDYWRVTGYQRIGFLYGTYEIHSDVPLGIRAVVAAIYEPPQESTRDSVSLIPDEKEPIVEELAKSLGMQRIGWVFTDLIPDDSSKGTVQHLRNIESHFLSAQECIMSGHHQNQHPNPCRFSPSGYFGSKFVTVCVTGDNKNQVHMEGYQVSNQCMSLVRDGCLVPTKEAPELGYIRESSDKQYVPDVYYKEKDSYGNEVPRLARPLPVEYLLVDVPASTPMVPQFKFFVDSKIRPFAVENRMIQGHLQDFPSLSSYLCQFSEPNQFLNAMSDFHLLIFVSTMDILPLREHMAPLLEAIRERDAEKALEWSRSAQWATVEELIAAWNGPSAGPSRTESSAQAPNASGASGSSTSAGQWPCPYCTFINSADRLSCDMCNLPAMPQ